MRRNKGLAGLEMSIVLSSGICFSEVPSFFGILQCHQDNGRKHQVSQAGDRKEVAMKVCGKEPSTCRLCLHQHTFFIGHQKRWTVLCRLRYFSLNVYALRKPYQSSRAWLTCCNFCTFVVTMRCWVYSANMGTKRLPWVLIRLVHFHLALALCVSKTGAEKSTF